jgi:hypothetical protein
VAISGWMNRQQQDAISYLRIENQILRERLGQKRIILNDNQKRRLAAAAMKLGKDVLRQFGTLFSPDTLLRWNRMLIARKYDGSGGKRGPACGAANQPKLRQHEALTRDLRALGDRQTPFAAVSDTGLATNLQLKA